MAKWTTGRWTLALSLAVGLAAPALAADKKAEGDLRWGLNY